MTQVTGVRPTQRVILVTYDLKTPGKVYTDFFTVMQQQGKWWHFLASTWLIATPKTAMEVYAAIRPYITDQDNILIVPIVRPYWGYLPKEAWQWINENLPLYPQG